MSKTLRVFAVVSGLWVGLSVMGSTAFAAPVDDVDPLVGTGRSTVLGPAVPGGLGGATQPAAVVPFGMVQIGPDSDWTERTDLGCNVFGCSGYHYLNSRIKNFSLTHMSGPGCANMGEVQFMPFTTEPSAGVRVAPATFSHANEKVRAGLYDVTFDDGVRVELTATERTGIARITFPASTRGKTVGFTLDAKTTARGTTEGNVSFTSPRSLLGGQMGGGFCETKRKYPVFFALEMDRDTTTQTVSNGLAKITFVDDGRPVLVKIGLSYVSKDGAKANLAAEAKAATFDSTYEAARAKWSDALSTVQVTTTDEATRKSFYTALYHSLLHPNVGSDVDGSYMGFDWKVRKNANRPHYVNFSGWDVYRSQIQLISFLFPKRGSDIAASLVDSGSQCGAIPKWSLNNLETNIMVGDPGPIAVASLYAFGSTSFDTTTALGLMKKSALDPKATCRGDTPIRPRLEDYARLGYVPFEGFYGGASVSLEYSSADFAIGKFAARLGQKNFAERMFDRSSKWRSLWDPSTSLIRPKARSGRFMEKFDPNAMAGYVEGNAVQYTYMIPHDVSSLVSKMGGNQIATQRLDDFMSKTNAGLHEPHLYLGNEPAFGVPWMYNWTRAPWKTQEIVRKLLKTEFSQGPGGLTGNDDLGALSSWAVWAALGMYPALPGDDVLVLATPAFSQITITPEGKPSIGVAAPDAESNVYVKGVGLGRQPWKKTWLRVSELQSARAIHFVTSPAPQTWGSDPGSEPPSLGDDARY